MPSIIIYLTVGTRSALDRRSGGDRFCWIDLI